MENHPSEPITPEEEEALNQIYNERENESQTESEEAPIPQENNESEKTDKNSEETTEEVKFATPKPQQTTEFKKPVINFFSPMSQHK